ncbi:LysR family transcriptional regulator [Paraburkholderia nemoris]|uniref:LysR family transcriptional regulator n=1 Tax=Paraburkholderia nemoris TaxID=2793076 RepID=UPI0038B85DCD
MTQPDLNFLYIIEALIAERSVSRAADRLGLSQPAVSHALARLRVRFQDDLLVRAGATMLPTPVGEHIAEHATKALAIIRTEILDAKEFDPATTTRTFSVCLSDMGVIVLLPMLLAAMRKQAPLATLRPIQVPSHDLDIALQDDDIDLAIGHLSKVGDTLRQQALFQRRLVGIEQSKGRRKTSTMALSEFVERQHVIVSAQALTTEILDKELRQLGARLQVGVEVPYLLSVPSLVAHSDFIAVIPDELAEIFGKLANLSIFALPIILPPLTVRQFWHPRFQSDAGHRWFRGVVAQSLR